MVHYLNPLLFTQMGVKEAHLEKSSPIEKASERMLD
jgi:hypothetical protein